MYLIYVRTIAPKRPKLSGTNWSDNQVAPQVMKTNWDISTSTAEFYARPKIFGKDCEEDVCCCCCCCCWCCCCCFFFFKRNCKGCLKIPFCQLWFLDSHIGFIVKGFNLWFEDRDWAPGRCWVHHSLELPFDASCWKLRIFWGNPMCVRIVYIVPAFEFVRLCFYLFLISSCWGFEGCSCTSCRLLGGAEAIAFGILDVLCFGGVSGSGRCTTRTTARCC